MKKFISILCATALLIGILAVCAVSASAVEAAQTMVDVKKGDEVTYRLTLGGVELPVIGCDFSVYYDSSLFEVSSVADFNDKTAEEEWMAVINPELDGEVRGNWSILNGVKFNEDRNIVTVNFKATADGTGHLSYFIRYMYDNNIFNSDDKPQITDYKFTCDVLVNGEPVLEKAQPELNVEETQTTGLFVNSVTGDSVDADADIPGTVVKKNDTNSAVTGGNAENNLVADDNAGNPPAGYNAPAGGQPATVVVELGTTADGYFITATDADGNATATADEAPVIVVEDAGTDGGSDKGGSSSVLWIIIALVVLAGGGAAVYFFMKKKPATAETDTEVTAPAETDAVSDETDKTVVADDEPDKTLVLEDEDPDKTLVLDDENKTQLADPDDQ